MAARRFKLPANGDNWRDLGCLAIILAGVSLGAGYLAAPSTSFDFWVAELVFVTAGIPFLLLLALTIPRLLKPPPQCIDVGRDGVLVGARFIPYADIGGVEHVLRKQTADGSQGSADVKVIWYRWMVSITVGGLPGGGVLLGGEEVEVLTNGSSTESGDPLGSEIVRSVKEAMAAWADGQRGDDLDANVSRGERTGSDWLEALRRVGSGAAASYRGASVNIEKLSRLLDNPQSKLSARAAAAVMLAAAGDTTAAAKLRIAAEALVDPRVRVALENVADETAVAEALEALEESDHERQSRPVMRRSRTPR